MKRLFVIMPFGVRKGLLGGLGPEDLDFDFVYQRIIRPAADEAGWNASRIDDIAFAGSITDQFIDELFSADVVVADVSLSNANVFYELGIRQSISGGPTILIAHRGTQPPFDIAHQRIIFYTLARQGALNAIREVTNALKSAARDRSTNPVQQFLRRAGAIANPIDNPAAFETELQGRIGRATTGEQLLAVWSWAKNQSPLPAFTLLQLAHRLGDFGEWTAAVEVLQEAVSLRPRDFELRRELGWHISKLNDEPGAIAVLMEALELNPDDPETLGMLGGIFKRLRDFPQAAEYYARGARLSRASLYIAVNEAAMAILVEPNAPERGIDLYREIIKRLESSDEYGAEWRDVVLGEAYFATGDETRSLENYGAAKASATSMRSVRSAAGQLELFSSVGFRSEAADRLAALLTGSTELLSNPIRRTTSSSSVEDSQNLPILLHISDVHFGRRLAKDGTAQEMHRFFDGDYSKRLSEHLLEEFCRRRSHFHYDPARIHLLISGDLTYTGKSAEFSLVNSFLSDVCKGLGIPHERVLMVPGNHDVCWEASATDRSHRFDNYIDFLATFYGDVLFRSKYPRITWDLRVNTPRPQASDIMTVYHNEEFRITIASLNSCVYEDEQQHYGFVGKTQLETLDEALSELPGPKGLRIAMFHHHLHPYPEYLKNVAKGVVETDLSTIRDAGIVERQLERLQFDVVLHGHKHRPQIRETRIFHAGDSPQSIPSLIVCGAGSVGVDASELRHNIPNQYQVVEVLRSPRRPGADLLRIESRTLDVAPEANWVTAGTWVLGG